MATTEKTLFEEISGSGSEILNQIKRLIREGNARRIVIKNRNGKILFQSQLTAGVAGTAFFTVVAPILSAISLFLLFVNDVQVLVEKDPDGDGYEVEAECIEITDEEEPEPDESDTYNENDERDKPEH